MSAAFTFVPADFRRRYPAFTEEKASDDALNSAWEAVAALLANREGLFPYPPEKAAAILFPAVCHILTLETSEHDAPGRVSSASQGSVSVSFDLVQANGMNAQWWNLTRCGALFWVLSAPYRISLKLYRGSNFHPWG